MNDSQDGGEDEFYWELLLKILHMLLWPFIKLLEWLTED